MPKPKQKFEKIAFVASDMPQAIEARDRLVARYGAVEIGDADAIVALGGDGQSAVPVNSELPETASRRASKLDEFETKVA